MPVQACRCLCVLRCLRRNTGLTGHDVARKHLLAGALLTQGSSIEGVQLDGDLLLPLFRPHSPAHDVLLASGHLAAHHKPLEQLSLLQGTMRFRGTAKVLAECKLKYYRISKCKGTHPD